MSMDEREIEEWAARLQEAAGGELRRQVHRHLVGLALYGEGQGKANATTRPRVRSGTLRRSVAGIVEGQPTAEQMEVQLNAGGRTAGGDVPYAAPQEYGATIRPRRARWLTIPTEHTRTRAGVARGGARSYGNLRFVPLRADTALLVEKTKRNKARGRIMFILKKRVDIPPTRFLGRAFDDMEKQADKVLPDIAGKVLP